MLSLELILLLINLLIPGQFSTSLPRPLANEPVRKDAESSEDEASMNFPGEPLTPDEFESTKFLENEASHGKLDLYASEKLYAKRLKEVQDEPEKITRNGVIDRRKRWPKKGNYVFIPYIISSKFGHKERRVIAKSFKNFHEKTCIRFIPRINQKDYIFIMKGAGCDSEAGRIGGEQTLSLGPGCEYTDVAIHELNHAIGFWHEQNRPDRDKYVTVHLENVIPKNRFNFNKMSSRDINSFGVEYDTNSIMHYDKYAFSKDPGRLIVMEPRIPNENMGFAKVLSHSDILRIRRMYKCGNTRKSLRIASESVENLNEFNPKNCQDFHHNCTEVTRLELKSGSRNAEVEICQKNAWVKVTCRKSCGTCGNPCQDMKDECISWVKSGACETQHEYMKLYCPKSCQFCQSIE